MSPRLWRGLGGGRSKWQHAEVCRMHKVLASSAALLSLALLTVVVGAATAQARSEKAKATTVTLSGWSSSPEENALLTQVVNRFNRTHANIKIDYSVIQGDYPTAMT